MANRAVFTLATALLVLSFLISHFDRYFFTLHFLESLIYLIIVLLLYYGVDEWAYVLGMAAPLFWIILAWAGGLLGGVLGGFTGAIMGGGLQNPIGFLSGLVFVGGLALLVLSARAFWRDVWGTPGAVRTLAAGTAVVVLYYAMLLTALLQMTRPSGELPVN